MINEIGCEGRDFVELQNTAAFDVVVDGIVVADAPDALASATPLTGTWAAGARVVVTPTFGIGCHDDVVLLVDGVVVDTVVIGAMPRGASWGRVPDGSGAFVATTPTPTDANTVFVDVAAALFDPLGPPLRIDIALTPEATASLRDGQTEFDYVPATLQIRGADFVDPPLTVGVRKKGKVGSRRPFDGGKMAWKIDFDRYVVGQRYRTLAKLNLNNMVQDPSTVNEVLAYRVYADAGLPQPRTGYATVVVHEGDVEQVFGTYLVLESFDDDVFLDRNFPQGTTALFEGGLLTPDCCDFADFRLEELDRFELDRGDPLVARPALVDLAQRIGGAPLTFFDDVGAVLDRNEAVTLMATESAIGHWDGYQSSPNNYYAHLGDDGLWRLFSAGVDQTFEHDPGYRLERVFYGDGFLFQQCRANPACRALYHQALTDAVDRIAALLRGDFPAYARALAAHNVATFSRERLEASLDDVPAQTEGALGYLHERILTLRADLACDDQPLDAPCAVVDENAAPVFAGRCQFDFNRSTPCSDGSLACNLTCLP